MKAHHRGNLQTYLERSRGQNSTGQGSRSQDHKVLLAASTRYVRIFMQREDIETATLNSHAVPACFFTLPPIDSTQVKKLQFS